LREAAGPPPGHLVEYSRRRRKARPFSRTGSMLRAHAQK
jgi:hypothetical protein